MTQSLWTRAARWGLPIILAVYLVLGTLYAVFTPAWQAPDEPAHYNYVRFLAEQHRFPILKLGDYPAAYLEEIKAARFPPGLSIDPIRYEFHQPPLYYLLAVPVYALFGGALLPLRLVSVLLGAGVLTVLCWTVREVAPERPFLALGTAAFAAFLPMHLAMSAAANNDTLAELMLALVLLLAVRYLKAGATHPEGASHQESGRLLVLLGITTGLGFLTKTSDYVAAPLVLAAIAARHLWLDRDPPPWTGTLRAVVRYLLPAIALGLPWWLRNVALYGGLDWLGLGRHAQVVAGQLRTSEFVAQYGAARLVQDFFGTSFRSFWGQFGWMGVLLDQRLYQALVLLSALACVGFLAWLVRAGRSSVRAGTGACPYSGRPAWQWAAGGLLALSGLLTLASYLWYNTSFLQHQGRYLFPALLPIGLAMALGWREALRRRWALPLAALALVSGLVLQAAGVRSTWLLAMLALLIAAFDLRNFFPRTWDPLVQVCPYLLLPVLDLACLFLFVVPQLAR